MSAVPAPVVPAPAVPETAGPETAGPETAGPDGRGPLGVFVGLATLDVVHRVAAFAGPDQKVTALRQDVAAGGPAACAAVTHAALGGRARLVTVLGPSPAAVLVRAELEACGVEVVDVDPASAAPVPVSAVQVLDATGERSVTSIDAAAHAPAGTDGGADPGGATAPGATGAAAHAALAEALEGAAVVLLDGHHPALALAAAAAVRGGAGRPGPEGAPPLLVDAGRWRPVFASLLPVVDVAICSADFRLPGTADPTASALAVRAAGTPVVVTTAGAGPVRWWEGERVEELAVPPVVAVDTLGAGDAFHGAFAHAVAGGADVAGAVRRGVAVARHRVSVVGPRTWLTTLTAALAPPSPPSTPPPGSP